MISLRRTYLIARRDFIGYVKTWGFWLSFLVPVIFGLIGFGISYFSVTFDFDPVRYETILDDTGQYEDQILAIHNRKQEEVERIALMALSRFTLTSDQRDELDTIIETEGVDAAKRFFSDVRPELKDAYSEPQGKAIFVDPPARTVDDIQPYLKGEKDIIVDGKSVSLNGLLHLYEQNGRVFAQYWSENITAGYVRGLAKDFFNSKAVENYLSEGGLTLSGLEDVESQSFDVEVFNPSKSGADTEDGQRVTSEDRLPFRVAAVMSGILWLTVFSGSYMLLTSMLEEKLNKLLEMMLASVRFSEIMVGKLIGVAALTIASMLPYILLLLLGVLWGIFYGDQAISAGLAQAFSLKMLIFFPLFLIMGYIFYGALFISLGALAESMQDAQTLTTPIMLFLTASVLVVPLGMNSPDSPLLVLAKWFPLSSPFAVIVSLPSNPSWISLIGPFLIMFFSSMFLIWLAGRIFKYGVMSGAGVKAIKLWFMRVILRRKPSA